jgi:membrane protein implicated in regulation of membrane protease activity
MIIVPYLFSITIVFRNLLFMAVLSIYFVRQSEKSLLQQQKTKQTEEKVINRNGSGINKTEEGKERMFAITGNIVYNSISKK